MKHIFVINPEAGPKSSFDEIKDKLEKLGVMDICELYETKAPLDATEFVRKRCAETPDETLRFYACGGDGTVNEVASGLVGQTNGEMTCYPCGSGNDYVKYYGGIDTFSDLEELMKCEAMPIDMMKVCGRYCINVCNFGFDALVAQTMINVKRKKLIGGKNAYTTGIVYSILKGRFNKCSVVADGEVLNPNGKMLLCTVANGQYVGGSFKCAPRSINNDGMLEVCLVKTISLAKFLTLLGPYGEGKHLDDKRFKDIIVYKRAKKVEVKADENFGVCIDGEMEKSGDYSVEVIPGAIKFAAPVKLVAKV